MILATNNSVNSLLKHNSALIFFRAFDAGSVAVSDIPKSTPGKTVTFAGLLLMDTINKYNNDNNN